MGDQTSEGRWCILRTSPARTIKLARSLIAAGVEAWTPTETVKRQKPRSNVKVEHHLAITPTFVFARYCYLEELARIRRLPLSPHPPFSILHHVGEPVRVRDVEIERLRTAANKAAPSRKRLAAGTAVHVTEGVFLGMSGLVHDDQGRWSLVMFGNLRVKVETCELRADEVQTVNLAA